MRRSGSHRSRRRTRIRTVNQERTPQIAYMRGEKRCGIRLSRNPIVAQSAEYPAGGEAHRPLPFCHTVIFSSYHHAHNQCNARTHHTPHGRRTYERNHVCISQDYFSQRYIARYFQHHLRHHHGETISYATSYYARNVHGHSQTRYFW